MSRRPVEATEVLKKTDESYPDIPQLKMMLGVLCLDVQKYEMARILLKDFVQPMPQPIPKSPQKDLATLRLQYGKVLPYMREYKTAIKNLEEANTLLPNAVGVLLPLGEAYVTFCWRVAPCGLQTRSTKEN